MSRNIVLISVDSLRADRCGVGRLERQTPPVLEAIGRDGIVFENAIAPGPNTPSSMPSIMTGKHIHGVDRGVAMRSKIRRHLFRTSTIADRLSKREYTTIGFTPNPFTSRYFGFEKGFDEFTDFLSSRNPIRNLVVSRWTEGRFIAGLRLGLNVLGLGDLAVSWEDYYDNLLSTVRRTDEPFFLWVFLLEPHWPYYPPGRYREEISPWQMYVDNWKRSKLSNSSIDETRAQRLLSLYDGTIRHVYEFVERLVEGLDGLDPVVVFHSDHGEAFGEHGLFGHGQYLYEENIHVPLVIGNIERTRQVEPPISLCAIPEIIDDLATVGRFEHEQYTDWRVTAHAAGKIAIRGQGWKYIRSDDREEFYDLESDPGETNNLTSAQTDGPLKDLSDRLIDEKDERERIEFSCQKLGRESL